MKKIILTHVFLLVILTGSLMGIKPTHAQQVFAYPKAGQSPQQQSQDQFECHQWAVGQTGYNPQAPQAPTSGGYAPVAPPPQSERRGAKGFWGSAARGAALGAAGGAIAGDAGKGAAIGSLTGALFGGIRRRSRQQEAAAWEQQRHQQMQRQQQQMAQVQQQSAGNFNRAFAICMNARNYQVQ